MPAETLDPVLPDKVQQKAKRALDAAHEQELKLATAESCTGGLFAALLTDVHGRGHVYDRGFVVYSKQAKCDLLGIAREKVDNCGAVSRADRSRNGAGCAAPLAGRHSGVNYWFCRARWAG